MWFRSLFDSCISRWSRIPIARKGCSRADRRWPARLEVEFLEDRCLLSAVHALFDLGTTASGTFPSDRFTVADTTQNTGRRVNLPLPNPTTHPSDYEDTQVLNTLDGFNLQPRLSIPFDGAIDVNTVTSNTVFLVSMGDTLNPHDHGGQLVGINQVVWDPATKSLHVESDEFLDQHARYALIVTNGVHDASGHPVEATLAFRLAPLTLPFSHDPVLRSYGLEMVEGLVAAHRAGVREQDIVTASVFTTQSATAILEKIRDQIHAATPDSAEFNLGPNGARTVFSLDQVTGITWRQQTGDDPPAFTNTTVNLSPLQVIPGAVSQLAFGKYLSPDYEVHPGEYIPPVGTRTGTPAVQGYNEIYLNLFLPSGPMPEGGWPVAIFGYGLNNNKQATPLSVAGTMAEHGIATIAINAVGHGFGPLGTLTVNQKADGPVTFSAGGRGIDQNGSHVITAIGGVEAAPPRTIISLRDGVQQTAADLMQLVRVIQGGMDVYGNGMRDLDPSHIYYFSHSFGGSYGAAFLAVEPSVRVGVLNAVGGNWVNKAGRVSPARRSVIGSMLAARVPSLLNSPGLTSIGGVSVAPPYFNENLPLRDQPPVINTVDGAMAIQEVFENGQWAAQSGNPLAYAPHIWKDPLRGMPAKSVIVQLNKGDQNAIPPSTTAFVRAGDLADRTTYYRNDLAFAEDPGVPTNPHGTLISITSADPLLAEIARGYQEQIGTFFASDGTEIIHPEPARFFEVPIVLPLPEDLNFIPTSPAPSVTMPVTVASGTPFDVTVQAVDVFGQVAFGYRGTVTFSVTDPDPAVVLPADYTFTADDQGTHTFTGEFTLITPGMWTLTAADLFNGLTQDVMLTVNP
jgi:hypothetical protein